MNIELLNQFRTKVNDKDLVFHLYHDYNGKNLWSIICSAMDWIEVVVEEIDIKKLTLANDNGSRIKVMNYISCISVLWESIQQLYRVFFSTQEIPFDTDNTIFQHKLFPSTDNTYFKTIRACFATHQVNLYDDFSGEGENERRYAGWSGANFGEGDFSVILYSNIPDQDFIFLNIYFDELQKFAKKRYGFLNNIMERIDHQIDDYLVEYRKRPIGRANSPLEQINILIGESKQRFTCDYYNYELANLKLIFETPICNKQNEKIVAIYRVSLKEEIEELYCALQGMRLEDLKNAIEANMIYPPDCQYEISKLGDAVFCDGYSCVVSVNDLANYLEGIVDLKSIHSTKELYVVVQAGFYSFYNHQ